MYDYYTSKYTHLIYSDNWIYSLQVYIIHFIDIESDFNLRQQLHCQTIQLHILRYINHQRMHH